MMRRALLAASLVLALGLWTAHLVAARRATGLFRDGAVYLSTASALAEGLGYRDVSLPGAPPEVHWPPLLPLALSAVWRVAPRFPENLPLLKGVLVVAAIGLVLLLPGYLRRVGFDPEVAVAAAALTALAPLTLRYATAIASDLLFATLAVAALAAVERAAEPERSDGAAALAGTLAGLAMLTRVVGVTVIAAGLVTLLRRADRRRVWTYALAVGCGILPWVAWVADHRAAAADQTYLTVLNQDGGLVTAGALLRHLVELPAAVALVTLPGLSELLGPRTPAALSVVCYAAGTAILALGLAHRFRLYVALSLLLAIAVPWFQPRFLVPLAPLFLAALLGALLPVGGDARRRTVHAVVVAALAVSALAAQATALARVRATSLPALEQVSDTVTWADFDAVLGWLRANTEPADVLGSVHDPLLYLYTRRQAVRAYPSPWVPDPAQVDAQIAAGRVRWLVELPCPVPEAHRAWVTWLDAHRDALTPVYSGARGEIRVWRVGGGGWPRERPSQPTGVRGVSEQRSARRARAADGPPNPIDGAG